MSAQPTRAAGTRHGGRDGFLLVEALSALAISALLIVALLSFTGLLRKSADRAAYRVELMESTNRTVWTIASEIRRTISLRWAPEQRNPVAAKPTATPQQTGGRGTQNADQDDGEPRRDLTNPDGQGQQDQAEQPERNFVFSGTPERVMFALAPEQANGLRAPVFVIYQIDAAGAVLRAEGAIRADAKGAGEVQLGPVARVEPGPERLRFAYVDKDPNGGETIVDAWTDQRRMPAAVRIDRTDPATGAPLASLRVPILLSAEPGCADPQQGFCSRADGQNTRGGAAQTGRPGSAPGQGSSGEQE